MQNVIETDWSEVYKASRYAFPSKGSWKVFALDGAEGQMNNLESSVSLVSALNPGSVEVPIEENQASNLRLEAALKESGVDFDAAWGASLPGIEPPWKEDGVSVRGLTRIEAAALGKEWGQQAVVWLDAESTELLFCSPLEVVPCGLRWFEEEMD